MRLRIDLLGVSLLTLLHAGVLRADENPLLVGLRLSEDRFKGWSYGHRVERRQIDCVQFTGAVVEELLDRKLALLEEELLYIKHIGSRRKLQQLVAKNDKRISGIQAALVQMQRGEVIEPALARVGDFVQYWRPANGRWYGHTGIIAGIVKRADRFCALVFGAHQSLGKVGVGPFELGLNDPRLKVFIVRFKSQKSLQ